MAGLKWKSINFEKERIRIENNRVNVNGKAIDGSPKSITSEMIISISQIQDIRNCLQQLKKWQNKKFGGCEYLMVNPQTRKPLCPQNRLTYFLPYVKIITRYTLIKPQIKGNTMQNCILSPLVWVNYVATLRDTFWVCLLWGTLFLF